MRTKAGLLGWVVAAWVLVPASCVLDWTVPEGAAGAGGAGGSTGTSTLTEVVCSTGETCTCPGLDGCDMACTAANCDILCESGAECDVGCTGGQCEVTCQSLATCDV